MFVDLHRESIYIIYTYIQINSYSSDFWTIESMTTHLFLHQHLRQSPSQLCLNVAVSATKTVLFLYGIIMFYSWFQQQIQGNIYICIYICISIYTYVYLRTYYTYIYIYTYIYCEYICIYIYIFASFSGLLGYLGWRPHRKNPKVLGNDWIYLRAAGNYWICIRCLEKGKKKSPKW